MTWAEFKRKMETEVGVKDNNFVNFTVRPNILRPDVVNGELTIDTATEKHAASGEPIGNEFIKEFWVDRNLPKDHILIDGKEFRVSPNQIVPIENPCKEIQTREIPRGLTPEEFDKWLEETGQKFARQKDWPSGLGKSRIYDETAIYRTKRTPQEMMSNLLRINNESGYLNDYGVRVPNPCGEIDMKGRDMDKIHRLMQPGWSYSDETLDALNSFRVPNCLCVGQMPLKKEVQLPYKRVMFTWETQQMFPTRYFVNTNCPLCLGTGHPGSQSSVTDASGQSNDRR